MTGCFSCFGTPRVKHESSPPVPKSAFGGKANSPSLKGKPEAINTYDKLTEPLLKASKKGSLAVAELCKDLTASKEAWSKDLQHTGNIRARASALQCCIDTLLAPLLEIVDASVGKPGKGGEAGWDGLQLKDLEAMIRGVCQDATGLTLQKLRNSLRALSGALQAVWAGSGDLRGQLAASFHNQSTNSLLGMVSVILCRQVTHEPQAVWQKRLSDWESLSHSLGLDGPGLPVSLSPQNKALLLYLINAAQTGESKVTLQVHRSSALSETSQILEKNRMILRSSGPVKVFPQFRLDASTSVVEAGEGHGPRKEFFHAVGQCMTQAQAGTSSMAAPPFSYTRSAGQYFLNLALDDTPSNRALMWTTGWLMAQTVSNRANLGIPLPVLLMQMLVKGTDFKPTMDLLAKFDPEVATGLKNVARLSDSDFKAMLELEDCPGMSRDQYLQHAVACALGIGGESSWIFNNLQNGFWSVFPHKVLQDLSVCESDLQEMVCGPASISGNNSDDFNVQQVFRIVLDNEMGGGDSSDEEPAAAPLARALWDVVAKWDPELKLQFVLFVTGSNRLPLPGTELLRVELPFVALSTKDQQQMLGMLPQAHTCENILELPNYWEALLRTKFPQATDATAISGSEKSHLYAELKKVLEERLMLAVTSCNSYGLDEGVGTSRGSGQQQPRSSGSALPPLPHGGERGSRQAIGTDGMPLERLCSGHSLGKLSSDSSSNGSATPSFLMAMMEEKVVPLSHPVSVLPAPVRHREGLQPLRDITRQLRSLNSIGSPSMLPVLGVEPRKPEQGMAPHALFHSPLLRLDTVPS